MVASDALRPAARVASGPTARGWRRLRRLGIGLDQRLRGALDVLERAGDEIAPVRREIEGLAGARVPRIRHDRAVGEELEPAMKAALDREVTGQKIAGPAISDGDAEAVTEVILRVPRHVDAVPAALGRLPLGLARRAGGLLRGHVLLRCFAHGVDDGLSMAAGPSFEPGARV